LDGLVDVTSSDDRPAAASWSSRDAGIASSSWRRLFPGLEGERRLDERGMAEGLRVVAEVLPGGRVHLFGVEAERAGQCQEVGEPLSGFGLAAGGCQRLDEPERTRYERSFGAGEPVLAGWVAVEQRPCRCQFSTDGVDGAVYPGRVD